MTSPSDLSLGLLLSIQSFLKFRVIGAMGTFCEMGKNGKLPWEGRPEYKWDLLQFREQTIEKIVILGRKTYESMGQKPLKNRDSIIIDHSVQSYSGPLTYPYGVYFVNNEIDAVILADQISKKKRIDVAWIIGGPTTYKKFVNLGIVEIIRITTFDEQFPDSDTYFDNEILKNYKIYDSKTQVPEENGDIICYENAMITPQEIKENITKVMLKNLDYFKLLLKNN